jgi:succinate dehydrogenase/fumarate reductase flavoprotein subunit
MFAIGTKEQKERYGEELPTDEAYWYDKIIEETRYMGNGALISRFINESANTVQYLQDKGVNMYLSDQPQMIAHFDTMVEYHRWNNCEPFKYLTAAMEDAGVDIHMKTTAQSLITDSEGNVTGAVCEQEDGSTLTINAKSVIVATGSFAGNESLMRSVLGNAYDNCMVMRGADLPGIEMMWNVGAAEGNLLPMSHGVTNNANPEVADQLTLNTPILWVNNQGKRFMSASLLKETTDFTTAVVAQGGYAYTIVDQATVDRWTDMSQENTGTWIHYWDRNGIIDENGNATIYHAPVDKDTFVNDFKTMEEAGEGIVADTIEEAAEFIGCDVEDLKTTIANYNTAVETGNDTEFHTDAEDLVYTVEEGPYYVTKGHAGVLVALGGVNVNDELEVLDNDNKVIKGLYAVGNNCSDVSVSVYSSIEGIGLGFALTSGRLAGATAAENAAN